MHLFEGAAAPPQEGPHVPWPNSAGNEATVGAASCRLEAEGVVEGGGGRDVEAPTMNDRDHTWTPLSLPSLPHHPPLAHYHDCLVCFLFHTACRRTIDLVCFLRSRSLVNNVS